MSGNDTIRRWGAYVLVATLLATVSPALSPALGAEDEKVIVLGFDGIDSDLTEMWMDDGTLPNLKRLRDQGGYAPLESVNPPQSPVSWSSFATGTNPGKHSVFGFIRRVNGKGSPPLPDIGLAKIVMKPTSEVVGFGPQQQSLYAGIAGFVLLAIGFALGKIFTKNKLAVPILLGVVLGGVAGGATWWICGELPEKSPVGEQVRVGDSFWKIAAENGVETVGLQLPMEFPVQDTPNSRLTAGLGVPDIQGSPGTWYLYTDGQFMIRAEEQTGTAGYEVKVIENEDGSLEVELKGPKNYLVAEQIAAIREKEKDESLSWKEKEKLETQRYELSKLEVTSVPLKLVPDWANKKMTVQVQGQEQALGVGEWSEWFRVEFVINKLIKIQGITRFALTSMTEDGHFELFMPPVNMSPENPPATISIASPEGFGKDLAAKGLYHTLGWACMTNPLKDEKIDEETFVQNMGFLFEERARLIRSAIEKKDWRLFIGVFGSTDRMAHMMYRLHLPQTEEEKKLAAKISPYMGVPYQDSIKWIYQKMDAFVGEIMDGYVDENTTLLILSDHGFSPFRRGVNLNTFLAVNGFVVSRNGAYDPEQSVEDLFPSSFFGDVKWDESKAYSLGLGKIFINLKGREAFGIVDPADKRAVEQEIIDALMALRDVDGKPVVKEVFRGDDIYSGPFAKDNAPDLLLGFHDTYRVSWTTTMGDFGEEVLEDNDQKWSGGHPSVHPELVTGILFTNKKLGAPQGAKFHNIMDLAPTVLKTLGVALPSDFDGRPLF
ncbi:MAG: alkaline phosphatase family protein [Planctomycetota bacterium]